VLSSTSYHSLPSRDMFLSLHSSPNHSSHGLIRPTVSRGEDAELAICSSVHASKKQVGLAILPTWVRTILRPRHVKVCVQFLRHHFHLFLPPAARICTRFPKIIPFPCPALSLNQITSSSNWVWVSPPPGSQDAT
jgi:hypothetical protein